MVFYFVQNIRYSLKNQNYKGNSHDDSINYGGVLLAI